MSYILFDIGGTKTQVALTEDLETFGEVKSFTTPAKFSDGVAKIIESINNLTNKKIDGIAGGIRGILNEEKSGIQNDTILKGWIDKSLTEELKKHFDVPVYLENDTAICGLGEAVFGAGKDLEIIAYHTVSSGVGGVKVENGKIDLASVGFEPGHQVLDIDRTILGEDITPTLENLISGTAIENRFNTKPYDIPQSDVVWDELAEYLGQGLRNTVLYWSPDVIILGGSMITGDPRIQIDAIRKYTVQALDNFVSAPLITVSQLGNNAGLYGAMAIFKQEA